MNDTANFVPLAASVIGVAPSTLLFGIFLLHLGAKYAARLIPDDKKGVLGGIRKAASVFSAEPSSRITDGTSIKDVATAALALPAVAAKVSEGGDNGQSA